MPDFSLSVSEVVRHPATIAGTLTAVLGGLINVPVVTAAWGAFYASAGQLFGALAVLSFLAEHVAVLQTTWVIVPMIGVGLVVLHRRATEWYSTYTEELDE